MKVRLLLATLALTAFFFAQVIEAQDNGSPKESTATLEKTLSWLSRHIEASFAYGYSTIETSADTVTASHHESSVSRTSVKFDDCNVSWRDGDQIIVVPLATIDPLSVVAALHSEANTKFDDELWELPLMTRERKKAVTIQAATGAVQTRSSVKIVFPDQESAGRFARALRHATNLCSEQGANRP